MWRSVPVKMSSPASVSPPHESVANVVIDLHASGAIFRPWSPLDGRSQRGPDAAIAVESARVPFSTLRISGRRLPVRSARSLRPAIGAVHRRLYEHWHVAACPPRRSVPHRHALRRSRRLPGRDHWDGSDPPQAMARSVHISLPRFADPGGKKGGSLPSTSVFPERHRRAVRRSVTRTGTAG